MSKYAVMPLNDYVDACDSIRKKTQKTENIKSSELPNKVDEVYETGKQVGRTEGFNEGHEKGLEEGIANGQTQGEAVMLDTMWEAIQGGGERTEYSYAFNQTHFDKSTFKPKYDFKPTTCGSMFQTPTVEYPVNMKELEEETGIVFDFSGCKGSFQKTFAGGLFSVLNVIDISNATNLTLAFYGGYTSKRPLKRIERLICSETSPFVSNTFGLQSNLYYIGFEGVVGKSIDLKDNPLTVESINKLFACLKDYSTLGGTYTVTLKADRENMLTAEEKAVATNKGWTLVWS
jgi:hypothetical protein